MLGALKFTNLTILNVHKPYKLINTLSSSTSPVAVTTAVGSRKILRNNSILGWWCRLTPCPTATLGGTAPQFRHSRKHGQNIYFYTSDSRDKGQEGHLRRGANNNFGTQMGSSVNDKAETQCAESDTWPMKKCGERTPVDSSKLLTLPTILTIGRVAAVPLLVGSMYWILYLFFA